MKLTDNFSIREFEASDTAARLGVNNSIPKDLIPNVTALASWLQVLRNRLCKHLGKEVQIVVSSGYRCPALNKAIGGSKTSSHMSALAADIRVPGLSVDTLFSLIDELMWDMPADQVIHEFGRWVHVGLAKARPRNQFLYAEKVAGKTLYRVAEI